MVRLARIMLTIGSVISIDRNEKGCEEVDLGLAGRGVYARDSLRCFE